MQSSSQIITTDKPTPNFLRAGCPSCRPANSVKALKGKYHIPWTCPKLTWGLPTLSLTNNSSWLPWGRVAISIISPLMPVPHATTTTNLTYFPIYAGSYTFGTVGVRHFVGHYMMTSFTLLHFAWNRTNHCGGTCSQLMSQVGGGKTGNRLRWSIPL